MDRQSIVKAAEEFFTSSPTNYVSPPGGAEAVDNLSSTAALRSFKKHNIYGEREVAEKLIGEKEDALIGMRFFKNPVFSIGRADDPAFETIKQAHVVGPHHKSPREWMPEGKTVISFFLPYEDRVVEANRRSNTEAAIEWLYTRVDGQQHILTFIEMMTDMLKSEGYRALAPQLDETYIMNPGPEPMPWGQGVPGYSTNWSERHVGFVTGLGTFGLSTCFISKAGCSGRLGSVITDWEAEPDAKDYEHYLDYCNGCEACFRRCPAGAISHAGKDHALCGAAIGKMCAPYQPRYGCGKCQSGLPCDRGPARKGNR
ncbi:MAG: 4Fe-4S binding protein [Oscillospiraceae bacterium]|jgi:epoxyqueuosine reductase QueG|nr:4Fe-4S binding protein [Oscillospiraceae bacterium]